MTDAPRDPGLPEPGGGVGEGEWRPGLSKVASWSGYILAVSYPVLALSAGARAAYQLTVKEGVTNYAGPWMSAVAAVCYLLAAIGFAVRRRWAWYLSVSVLTFETVMVLAVGTLSLVAPNAIGSTVWSYYGVEYGFFPLFQPLLGLVWLLWPETRRAYGIGKPWWRPSGQPAEPS